jgi:hypothetical protein
LATKILEVVVCDLCKTDRPAIGQRTIDVCGSHDAKIEERQAALGFKCVCGRSFPTDRSLNSHVNRSSSGTHAAVEREG